MRPISWRRATGAVAAVAVLTTIAACSTGSGGGDRGEGIDPGATQEEYIAAFEDVDPIELNAQTIAAPDDPQSTSLTEYFDSITEWSGGKITFNVAYAQSVAPINEVHDALRNGTLDIAQFTPGAYPQEFPTYQEASDLSFLGTQTPVGGFLSAQAWLTDLLWQSESYLEEFAADGMQVIVPVLQNGSISMACSDRLDALDELDGAQVSASQSSTQSRASALGAVPQSMSFPEIFESLDRGIIECGLSSPTAPILAGYIEKAPYILWDDQAGFGTGWSTIAMSKQLWDALPLVAQQLIHDRSIVFYEQHSPTAFADIATLSEQAIANGGGIFNFADDAQQTLDDFNAARLEEGGDLAELAGQLAEEWTSVIAETGYEIDVSFYDFAEWYGENADSIDLTEYLGQVGERIIADNRPE